MMAQDEISQYYKYKKCLPIIIINRRIFGNEYIILQLRFSVYFLFHLTLYRKNMTKRLAEIDCHNFV